MCIKVGWWNNSKLQLILIRDTKLIKCTDLFLRFVYRSVALNISRCFDRQGTISREPNNRNKTHNQIYLFCTQLTWGNRAKYLKCRHFFVELLYKCAGSPHTVSWMQPTYLTNVSTLINYSTKECLHFNYSSLLRHVKCVDKVTNLVECGIALVCFFDDDPLWIEKLRNIQCDIIM